MSRKKNDNKKVLIIIAVILALAMLFSALIIAGYIKITPYGIFWGGQGIFWGNQGSNNEDGGNGNGDNGDGGENGQSHIGTYINLDITPNDCNREDYVTFTITSDFRNVDLILECQYVGLTGWQQIGTVSLGNSGSVSQDIQQNSAGEWNIRARYSTTLSNTENLIVKGITIYQQKSEWYIGETYTGQLTGTYKNWWVLILWKNHSDNTWFFQTFSQTDAIGMIPYGKETAYLDSGTIPGERDVIALIDPNDPNGYYLDVLMEEYYDITHDCIIIPNSVIENEVNAGNLVKSNILTFNINA